MASSITGGNWICFTHDNFETDDLDTWNQHCVDTGHVENVETNCVDCGTGLKAMNVPYNWQYPDGKRITYRCKPCLEKYDSISGSQSVVHVPNFRELQQMQQQQKEGSQ